MAPNYLIVVGKEHVRVGHDGGMDTLVHLRTSCSLSQATEEVIGRQLLTAWRVDWCQQGHLETSFVGRFNFKHPDAIRMSSSDFAQEFLTGDT